MYIPSSIQGLIPGGQNLSNRQTVFFLPVDPMDKEHKDPDTIDLGAPRLAQYMHKTWKKHQNTVCWVDINLALEKGLKFYQTRSNAIILHETLPACCIPKVVRMETGEVIFEKVFASPRPPPKISLKHDWMKELGSEVAQRPDGQVVQQVKSSQLNQPNPNPDHDRTGQPVVGCDPRTASGGRKTSRSQEIETRSFHVEAVTHDRTGQPVVGRDTNHEPGAPQTRSSDDSKSFNVEDRTAHDRTGQPVVDRDTNHEPGAFKTCSSHESTNFNVGDETNHDRTGQPVVGRDASHEPGNEQSMLNEVEIDFRIPGPPHSVVKQAQNSRVRELVKKIENHPHRHALKRDLQQNKAYNPFSTTTKHMIQDVGNVELFELFETDTKTQCKKCLSYWSEGIVYCTCGQLLKEIVASRGFIECTLDLLSIPEYVIKKGRPHGHRYGKTAEKKEYHLVHNLKKRDASKENSQGSMIVSCEIMFFFFRKRMIQHDRDEDVCLKWDDLAEQDFTYQMSESEYFHCRQNWWISLNKSGDTGGPLRNRSDFNQALSTLNRLHRESGGQQLRPMPYWMYQQRQPSSSSSSTWWQWSESWWSS